MSTMMNADQFIRSLRREGVTVEPGKGKGGHVGLRKEERFSVCPTHGGSKQLGTGLMRAIRKQLGLD